ncbi:flagellar filament capping protein FliD [Phycicoccus jejuensis]|uniref:flagellar filament capping protein FliD n=1 Tax=Phycicoccus jejuensis TaxID=367299 RepID=UPI00384C99F5
MAGVDGLISGLNTTQIISQLMTVERQSGAGLTKGKTASQTMVSVLQSLNTQMLSLRDAAKFFVPDPLLKTSGWTTTTSTSSAPSAVSVVTDGTALSGTTTFTVSSVASAGSAVSKGSVASTSTAVTAGPVVAAKGLGALGASALLAGTTLAAGSHTVKVTQASGGATLSGVPLGSTVTIGSGAQLVVDLGSGPQSISIAAGTYTPSQLAAEVTRAAGGGLTATAGDDGALRLATTREGSAASLQVVSADPALGLTDTTTTAHGTDGVVEIDGVATTLSDLGPGSTVTLAGAGTDSVQLSLAGGLRAGTATLADLGLAAGSNIAQVASAATSSSLGLSGTTIKVGDAAYKLQLTSSTTGAASDVMVSAGAFGASGLGDLVELQTPTDTVLRVGTGPGAFDVRSASKDVTGLLPGTTITATKADPTTPVTVTVAGDSSGIADKMQALVDAANAAISFIGARSGFNGDTKTAGVLLGNSLTQNIVRRVTDAAVGGSASQPSAAGITVGRDGKIALDRTAFLAAYAKDPAKVTANLTKMASSIADVAQQAADPLKGSITNAVKSEQGRIRDYTNQIASFETRMSLREDTLKRQYAALESLLGTVKSQGDWLTGQLKTLPTNSSSN